MTTELVLLLAIFAFLVLGVFLGPSGPIGVFKTFAPRLGARVERNVGVGNGYRQSKDGRGVSWVPPLNNQ